MSAAELPSPTITTLREAGPPNHHDDKVHSDQQVVNSLPWREAGPPNHHDDKVHSDQQSPTITTLREAGPPNHHDDKVHSDQQVVNSRGVAEPDDHHPARRTLLNL